MDNVVATCTLVLEALKKAALTPDISLNIRAAHPSVNYRKNSWSRHRTLEFSKAFFLGWLHGVAALLNLTSSPVYAIMLKYYRAHLPILQETLLNAATRRMNKTKRHLIKQLKPETKPSVVRGPKQLLFHSETVEQSNWIHRKEDGNTASEPAMVRVADAYTVLETCERLNYSATKEKTLVQTRWRPMSNTTVGNSLEYDDILAQIEERDLKGNTTEEAVVKESTVVKDVEEKTSMASPAPSPTPRLFLRTCGLIWRFMG